MNLSKLGFGTFFCNIRQMKHMLFIPFGISIYLQSTKPNDSILYLEIYQNADIQNLKIY